MGPTSRNQQCLLALSRGSSNGYKVDLRARTHGESEFGKSENHGGAGCDNAGTL
jgi:hypothetical protein